VSRRGWVLFTLMSVIWGIPYLLIKVADGGVSVPVLVFARTGIGALVLLPLALRRRELGATRAHWRWLLVFAAVEIIAPWALLSDAERRLPSSLTGILIASVPVIAAVLARVTGDCDRLTVVRWTGLALGLGGVVLLAGPTAHGGDAWAVTEVLLTALGYSIGPLIASRKLSAAPSLGVNAVCLSFAALVYAPFAVLTRPHAVPHANVIASIVALGVVCTGAAFMFFFALIAEVGPARATVITYVNPAVAVALGVAVLGEHLTPAIAASFVLILAGSFFATRSGRALATPTTGAAAGRTPTLGASGTSTVRAGGNGAERPEEPASSFVAQAPTHDADG
jgi:drug/metabolite transporter (DMT)-like permease